MSHAPIKHLSEQKSVEDLTSEMQVAVAGLHRLIGDLGKRHTGILSRMKELEEASLMPRRIGGKKSICTLSIP